MPSDVMTRSALLRRVASAAGLEGVPILTRQSGIHPALRGIGLECRHIGVRLLAYLGGLAVLAVIAADLVSHAPAITASAGEKSPWLAAVRPYPAFSVPLDEFDGKSISYEIFRHAEGGGRRDILTWSETDGGAPIGRLQIYRPGGEPNTFGIAAPTLAASAGVEKPQAVQPAGIIDSKFGQVPLFALSGPAGAGTRCMGFLTAMAKPKLEISGWFCPAEATRPLRTLVACAVDRLTLLSSGNDAEIAALFAQAELRRGLCNSAGAVQMAGDGDWISALGGPQLRGAVAARH